MPFKKGQSGNPNGRKSGSQNKGTHEAKVAMRAFFLKQIKDVEKIWKQLEPKEKADFLIKMAPYIIPKEQPIIEGPNDNQDRPIHKIKVGDTEIEYR